MRGFKKANVIGNSYFKVFNCLKNNSLFLKIRKEMSNFKPKSMRKKKRIKIGLSLKKLGGISKRNKS